MNHNATLARWMARPWFFTLWCVLAAFGAYACMYGFRKPFTAAGYGGADAKAWLVTAQVLGYTLSKFIGIKVIAEMTATRRARVLLGIIAIAELSLLLFGLTPAPFNAVWMFLNGLVLGMVFGLVLGFVEGRCLTEFFVAGLCASFILSDGVAKSVGSLLLQAGVSEPWMPSTAGLIFALPLMIFVWMLTQIPAPTPQDEAARSQRVPMTRGDRFAMLRRHGVGLFGIVFAYLLITVMRSIRADFAPEIWSGLGMSGQPAVFTQSELWVTLGVVVTNGALVLVRENRRAFFIGIGLAIGGLAFALTALLGHHMHVLPPFVFMVLLGVGMYVPYVAVHTTIFERLIALTRERGNIGYLMYLADAAGYFGYVAVMLLRSAFPRGGSFLDFFRLAAGSLLVTALVTLLCAWFFFARHSKLADGTAQRVT